MSRLERLVYCWWAGLLISQRCPCARHWPAPFITFCMWMDTLMWRRGYW